MTEQHTDTIEILRCILEREQCRPVEYEEAREVGDSLLSFYEVLAETNEQVMP
jgi:hypothetical protein